MGNERITEDFVRAHFKNDPLFSAIKLDEQKPSVAKAKRCLAKASKNLTGKSGSPEFIVTFPALPDDIIVVECKADAKFHQSDDGQNPASFAVDGALHYSAFLAQEYNVISIAVSGDTLGKLKLSSFYQKKGETEVSQEDAKLLDIFSYITRFKGELQAQNIESAEITKTAIELNKELNDYSIVEYERCTLVSAILLALQNTAFKTSYKAQATSKKLEPTPERLARQLEFIENALACLQPGGRCVAIVQMSCVTSSSSKTVAVRERLLHKHTLKGVFSMPDDLFHPVGVITCIMVFDAHTPQPKGFKTFFGYFKDDGFRKTKHMGRVNKGGWEKIKARWLDAYLNREKVPGLSVLQSVSATDEWCAEAYMETDYSTITKADFLKTVRDYAIHRLTLETM